jgi:hypothetical protein
MHAQRLRCPGNEGGTTMNRWPDGRALNASDLEGIAEESGADMGKLHALAAGLHNEALYRSHLLTVTAPARLHLLGAGALTLNTRTEGNHP